MYDITTLRPESLWQVIFKDAGSWRAGLYRPEATGPEDINTLEKHSCPELFICLGGRMGLILKDAEGEHIAEFQPNQALMIEDYHNGFAIDPVGYFLVVERTSFTTEYIDRKTGNCINIVTVHDI
ncbi:MAG: hypothetical protein JW807_02760 [Spirochaetes bacterium]|nr:hypothetical protein [Spirochaetota bacterium]